MITVLTAGTGVDRVIELAQRDQPSTRIVVIRGTSHRRSTLAAFAEALDFPGYFGMNLDALLDCLRDLPEPTTLIWQDADRLRRGDPAGYARIVDVLTDWSAEASSAGYVIG